MKKRNKAKSGKGGHMREGQGGILHASQLNSKCYFDLQHQQSVPKKLNGANMKTTG